MKKEFLRQVAEVYIQKHEDSLRDFIFVFPNRRSSVFFQRYLGLSSTKPIFAPEISTINNLFSSLSGLLLGEQLQILHYLYQAYQEVIPNFKETFDEFLFWGDTILNDFDDIDKYLVDSKKIFTNISDLSEIDEYYSYLTEQQREAISKFWGNLLPYQEGEKEQNFINVWRYLFAIYTKLHKSLEENGVAYEGMIYRSVAENLEESCKNLFANNKKIVFVGLNALNKCEKALLDYLKKQDRAHFYWDYYGEIIRNTENKSSFFMDENVRRYNISYPLQHELENTSPQEQEINVISIPSMVGQAKQLPDILKKLGLTEANTQEQAFRTAIVLPDEKLLLPVLNSIPSEIGLINVTMGYSLSNSNCMSFMSSYAALYQGVSEKEGQISFYYKNVIKLLNHPYIGNVNPELVKKIREEIVKANMIYVPSNLLVGSVLLERIFKVEDFSKVLLEEDYEIIAQAQYDILDILKTELQDLEAEFLYSYHNAITKLCKLKLPIKPATYFRLLNDSLKFNQIPFKGEPLSGLQIMGNLEMRALDFENLIILSVNDGVFPSRSVSNSFIPYSIRLGFDMPNYEYQDAIAAYHFYRSIYRAKKVYLLYDSRTSGLSSGEVSRFVMQLKYHHKVKINEYVLNQSVYSKENEIKDYEKTQEVFSTLDNMSFSPSSINTYIDCPRKFYFQYVCKLREPQEVSDEVEASMFGLLYHKIMQEIYTPYLLKDLGKKEILGLMASDDAILKEISLAFKSEMGVQEIVGRNKIIEALLLKFIKKTLKIDSELGVLRYVGAEQKCYQNLELFDGKKTVKLFGIIDRVDKVDGMLRVIDYKTGRSEIDYKGDIVNIFRADNKTRPSTALQLLFYLVLLENNTVDNKKLINPEETTMLVYSLSSMFQGIMPGLSVTRHEYEQYRKGLISVLEEIYNPEIKFTGALNAEKCKYCYFKSFCRND